MEASRRPAGMSRGRVLVSSSVSAVCCQSRCGAGPRRGKPPLLGLPSLVTFPWNECRGTPGISENGCSAQWLGWCSGSSQGHCHHQPLFPTRQTVLHPNLLQTNLFFGSIWHWPQEGPGCHSGSSTSVPPKVATCVWGTVNSGSGPECCGLEAELVPAGRAHLHPSSSLRLQRTLFSATLLTPDEPHRGIKSRSKMRAGKEWQVGFKLLSLLFSFKSITRLHNRYRHRQYAEQPHLPMASCRWGAPTGVLGGKGNH